VIRETEDGDLNDILDVEKRAFGYEKEAQLTSLLLKDISGEPILSLMAFHDGQPVGHVLFTRVTLEGMDNCPLMYILAPLAVKPEYQQRGIGGLLIRYGLGRLAEMGSEIVFVLGHMEYYPRYGFIPDAGKLGFEAPYPIPLKHADAWMVQALTPKGLDDLKGRIVCADSLNRLEHWRE